VLEGSSLPQATFKGTVFSSNGEGQKFISLPWVKRQIQEKLGFTPYPGTLNIRLTKESVRQKKLLKKAEKFEISPEKGYCTGILIEAHMEGLKCGIVLPQIPSYPQDVFEVVAAWNLRERFKIKDGSEVRVTVRV
jgi:riboflavin kinase